MSQELIKVQTPTQDGFDERYDEAMGRSTKRLKFDAKTESKYFLDGVALMGVTFVAINCYEEMVRWHEKKVIDRFIRRPDEPFQSAAERNEAVSRSEWGLDFNGNPEGPWKHNHAIELLDLRDASKLIFSNSTWGHLRCYFELKESIQGMRLLQGTRAYPIVAPAFLQMKTKYGTTLRPHLEIRGWRTFGPAPAAIAAPQGRELTSQEIIQDDLPPWNDELADVVK